MSKFNDLVWKLLIYMVSVSEVLYGLDIWSTYVFCLNVRRLNVAYALMTFILEALSL